MAGRGAGIDNAAAGIQHRAFCRFKQLYSLRNGVNIALNARGIVAFVGFFRLDICAFSELDVLGDVDQNGAGAAVGGNMEGLMQRVGKVVRILDQPVMLGAGAGDADGVRLLKGIVADHEGWNLTGQNNHRDRVHQRICHAGNGIGCAGAGGYQNNAGFTGGAGVALSRVGRGLFVANQDVADVILLKDLIIDRQDSTARIAKYGIDALIFQGFDDDLCTRHTGHGSVSLTRGARGPVSYVRWIHHYIGHKKTPDWGSCAPAAVGSVPASGALSNKYDDIHHGIFPYTPLFYRLVRWGQHMMPDKVT